MFPTRFRFRSYAKLSFSSFLHPHYSLLDCQKLFQASLNVCWNQFPRRPLNYDY